MRTDVAPLGGEVRLISGATHPVEALPHLAGPLR
ncbi:hypothetical protein J2W56_005669 [Nocardia kruczakiae]|uniref:Uncharacterized protein n=1 Tax=Nocardia kruczakiae TaxID=261477 RepID=A0ABU1XMX8_9NOCA|nr:hypothetical protein [Nocardia kruczakiae]